MLKPEGVFDCKMFGVIFFFMCLYIGGVKDLLFKRGTATYLYRSQREMTQRG